MVPTQLTTQHAVPEIRKINHHESFQEEDVNVPSASTNYQHHTSHFALRNFSTLQKL